MRSWSRRRGCSSEGLAVPACGLPHPSCSAPAVPRSRRCVAVGRARSLPWCALGKGRVLGSLVADFLSRIGAVQGEPSALEGGQRGCWKWFPSAYKLHLWFAVVIIYFSKRFLASLLMLSRHGRDGGRGCWGMGSSSPGAKFVNSLSERNELAGPGRWG